MEERLRSHSEALSRAIGFTRAADAKAAPVLVLQLALAGTLGAKVDDLWDILAGSSFDGAAVAGAVLLVLYATLLLASMAFAAWVYIPRNPRTGRSLIYFEDIAALPAQAFVEQSSKMDAAEIERQYLEQVHAVSRVASTKMYWARWAYFAAIPSVALWVVLLAWASL